MRKVYSNLLLAGVISIILATSSPVVAADKVVVIPLGGAKNYMYWQGEWVTDKAYKVGDGVHINGSSYMCIAAHTSVAPPDIDYWSLLAVAGKDGVEGATGHQGLNGDTGDQGIQGLKGDNGDTGDQGIQGLKGDNGDTGDQGLKGDKGEAGVPAMSGYEVINTPAPSDYQPATANCSDISKVVIGGGCSMSSASLLSLHDNYPIYGNQLNGWYCSTNATPPYIGSLHAYVICVDRQ